MKHKIFTILSLLISSIYFSQTYTLNSATSGTTVSTCTGTFVDDGGVGGTYTNSQNRTITFCPGTAGQAIKVTFTSLVLAGTTSACEEILDIYQGDAAYAAPLITALTPDDRLCGTYTGAALPVIYSSAANGCITFHFRSTSSGRVAGWVATISCVTPCKNPTASLLNSSIATICGPNSTNPGSTSVNFDASTSTLGAYSSGSYSLANYYWTFGDGTTATTTVATTSHTYPNAAGIYRASLIVGDNNTDGSATGCQSTNAITKVIQVLPAPTFTSTTNSPQSIGCGSNATLTGVATSQTETQNVPAVAGVTVTLPDGSGNSFVSNADFSGLFPTGATISAGCYPTLWFNLEHSYSGDLYIDLISPSGQTVRVYNRNGGDTNFGTCSNGLDNGVPGCGQTYSVSNTGILDWSLTTSMTSASSACPGYTGTCEGGSNYRNGVYASETPFSNLIGATMNGVWQIRIYDNLNLDDGFLFGWGLVFPASCYAALESTTPDLTTAVWTNGGSGPAVPVSQTTSTLSVSAPGPDACPSGTTCVGTKLTNTINFGPFNTAGTYPYIYNVNDEYGCSYTKTVNVEVSCACPTISLVSYDGGSFCKSLTSDVPPSITGSGSISGGTFSSTPVGLSLDASTGVFTPSLSTANTYTVTYLVVPSLTNCPSASISTVITIYSNPTVAVTSNTSICNGTNVTLTASDANSYSWSNGSTTSTISVNPTTSTIYTVTGTTNGCIDTETVSVTVIQNPTVTVTNTTICNGNSVVLTAGSATSYSWNTGETTSTISVTPTSLTVYTVTGTTSGCTNTKTVSVTVNSVPVTSASNSGSITCATPTISLTSTLTGVSYTWTAPSGGSVTNANTQNTSAFGAPGVYSLSVINPAGCTYSTTTTVNENIVIPNGVNAGPPDALGCGTASVITLMGSVATPTNATVLWEGISFASTQTLTTVSVNGAGIYTLTATDPINGCALSSTVQVFANANSPTVSVTSPTIGLNCNITSQSATVTSNPSTDVTYTWNNLPATISTNGSIASFTNANTYVCIVTNTVNNCSTPIQVVVTSNTTVPTTTASVTGSLTCLNTTVILNSSLASMNYTWTAPSTGSVTNANSQNALASLSGGTYSLDVVNPNNGCTYSTTVNVVQDITIPLTTPIVNGTITCVTSTVTLDANISGVSSYNWTEPANGNLTSLTASITVADHTITDGTVIYTLTVVGLNGCTYSTTASVTNNTVTPAVDIITTGTLTCVSSTVGLSTSNLNSGMTYAWSAQAGSSVSTSTTNSTIGTGIGNYNLTITDAANGCTNTAVTSSVPQNTVAPTITLSNTQTVTCNNPTAIISSTTNPPTGISYVWSGTGVNGLITNTVSVSSPALYSVVITNAANGCTNTASSIIDQNITAPTVSASNTGTLTCLNLASVISTTTNPPTGISYVWSGTGVNGLNTNTVSVTSGGVYSVAITNTVNGCTNTASLSVVQNTVKPTIVTASTIIACTNTYVIDASSPSDPNTTYSWSAQSGSILSGSITASLTVVGNVSGQYVVTVTSNDNGCTNTGSVNITVTPVVAAFSANPMSGAAPLAVGFTNQSTGANEYTWTFADGNTSIAVNPSNTFSTTGSYVVTLLASSDGFCSSTATLSIEVYDNTTLIIPNVFTPNGDGKNDVFKITSTGLKDLNCTIFNRWGTKLYTIESTTGSWDGNGSSDGTYFYILIANGMDGKEYKQQGTVNLFR